MKKTIKTLLIIIILFLLTIIGINYYVILSTKNQIDNKNIQADYIIVLGAGIKNNRPSPMLEDRLTTAIELYNKGRSNKILVSGDHENDDYDEVTVMKNYLLDKGIPIDDIYIDSLGLSTYDSIYRAKEVYNINSAIVVTQKYHLYSMNLDYYGVSSDKRIYHGQGKREIREILARNKDFVNCLLKSKSKHTELKEEV